MHLAEIAGGAQLILLRKVLVADAQNDVLIEGIADRLHGRFVEGLSEVDAGHLGAERRRQRLDGEGHWRFLFPCALPRVPQAARRSPPRPVQTSTAAIAAQGPDRLPAASDHQLGPPAQDFSLSTVSSNLRHSESSCRAASSLRTSSRGNARGASGGTIRCDGSTCASCSIATEVSRSGSSSSSLPSSDGSRLNKRRPRSSPSS